ncbi:MAG TPA: hypothetical protein DEB06_04065 [Phycisphaerales bacterium]|nr:hypothetical protein [Phycisphaerales bacterium]
MCRALIAGGRRVRALVRDRDKSRDALGGLGPDQGLTAVIGDVFNPSAVKRLLTGCDAVVHTIGIRRELPPEVTFARHHPGATRAVLDGARSAGVRRFVHISALGTRADAPSAYHRSKFESEGLVRASGLEWTILRPSLIHGPDGEFVRMVKGWVLGRSAPWFFIPYFARVEVSRSFPPRPPRLESALVQPVHVDDVAAAGVRALEMPEAVGEVYPLTGPESLDWPEVIGAIRDAMHLTDRRKRLLPMPGPVGFAVASVAGALGLGALLDFGPSEPLMATEDQMARTDKAGAHLGFRPRRFHDSLRAYAPSI